jgi:hypothetical protein
MSEDTLKKPLADATAHTFKPPEAASRSATEFLKRHHRELAKIG